jgi:MipA family protein
MKPRHRTLPPALRQLLGALLAASLTVVCGHAAAQDGLFGEGPPTGGTEIVLGLGLAHGPVYLGSDRQRTRALPVIAARWSNGWFAGTPGIGWGTRIASSLSGGLRLTLDRGRDEDDAPELRGTGDNSARPELGGFLIWTVVPRVSLGTSVRYGSGNGRDGLLVDVSTRGGWPLSPSLRLTVGASITAANSRALASQFGIDATQSAVSGYGVYMPGAGWRDASLTTGLMWLPSPGWMLGVSVQGRTLLGDARNSPLVRERSSTSVLATLGYRL